MKKLYLLLAVVAMATVGCAGAQKVDEALDKANSALDRASSTVEKVANTVDKASNTIDRAVAGAEAVKAKAEALPGRLESAVTGEERHVVNYGECLWIIDQVHGGDGFGWYGIYRANRDQIVDYNKIDVGMNFRWNRRTANSAENRQRAYDEPPFKRK